MPRGFQLPEIDLGRRLLWLALVFLHVVLFIDVGMFVIESENWRPKYSSSIKKQASRALIKVDFVIKKKFSDSSLTESLIMKALTDCKGCGFTTYPGAERAVALLKLMKSGQLLDRYRFWHRMGMIAWSVFALFAGLLLIIAWSSKDHGFSYYLKGLVFCAPIMMALFAATTSSISILNFEDASPGLSPTGEQLLWVSILFPFVVWPLFSLSLSRKREKAQGAFAIKGSSEPQNYIPPKKRLRR